MPDRAAPPETPATDEIEITPQMIRAGIDAYLAWFDRGDGYEANLVRDIYTAMKCREPKADLGSRQE